MKKISAILLFFSTLNTVAMENRNIVTIQNEAAAILVANNEANNASINLLNTAQLPETFSFSWNNTPVTPEQKTALCEAFNSQFALGKVEHWVVSGDNRAAQRNINLSPIFRALSRNGGAENNMEELLKNVLLAKRLQDAKNLLTNSQAAQIDLITPGMLNTTEITYEGSPLPVGNSTNIINALNQLVLHKKNNQGDGKTHTLDIADCAKAMVANSILQCDANWIINHPQIQFPINENIKDFNNYLENMKYHNGLKFTPKHEMKKKWFPERHWILFPTTVGLFSVLFSEQIKYAFWGAIKQAPLIWANYFARASANPPAN